MAGITKVGAIAFLACLYLSTPLRAATTPYDIDVNELDRQKPPAPKESAKPKKPKAAQPKKAEKAPSSTAPKTAPKAAAATAKGGKGYVVQEGDYRLKTLAKHLHISEEEAERLLPEILRLNDLSSLADLQLGQTLRLPAPRTQKSQPQLQRSEISQEKLMTLPHQICLVRDKEPARIVDSFLNALQLPWNRNRIIESSKGAPKAFSVRVDRFFILNNVPHVITVEQTDPYSYTLLRVLESSGYKMVQINATDDFRAIGEKILNLAGVTPNFGPQAIDPAHAVPGFAVLEEGGKSRMIITDAPVDAGLQGILPEGCAVRQ